MGAKTSPKPDNDRVYSATKNAFSKPKGKKKKLKAIRKVIAEQSCDEDSDLRKLVDEYGIETISKTVQNLLKDEKYEFAQSVSTTDLKLFTKISTQSEQSTILEIEFSHSEETTTEEVVKSDCSTDKEEEEEGEEVLEVEEHVEDEQEEEGEDEPCNGKLDADRQPPPDNLLSPSLFPIHFPFDAEHLLMERLQTHLERISFGFGERTLPDVLARKKWNCPESAELNRWPNILKKLKGLNMVGVGAPAEELFQSIVHIRHTAVHRLRTDSDGLERFLKAAELYSKLLGDEPYSKAMSQLKSNVESVIDDLRQHKLLLQQQQEGTRRWIAEQRAELDRLEKESVTRMVVEDKKYQRVAGDRLKRAVLHLEGYVSVRNVDAKGSSDKVNNHDQVEHEEEDEFYDCEIY